MFSAVSHAESVGNILLATLTTDEEMVCSDYLGSETGREAERGEASHRS